MAVPLDTAEDIAEDTADGNAGEGACCIGAGKPCPCRVPDCDASYCGWGVDAAGRGASY